MALELPGYQFVEKIGEGGMATVYRGQQLSLKRSVAIKVLNAQLRNHGAVRKAFEKESLIIARLSHPNIVPVFDRGVSERGTPFFIMQFIEGVDLARVLRQGMLSITRKLELALQIGKALAYAHRNGVVHRDIKPANVLVDPDWNVRVVDFGIAQLFTDGALTAVAQSASADQGWIMGTEAYMAPEVADKAAVSSVQGDLYSLGVILFEMLTGQLPDGSPTPPSSYVEGVVPELDRLVLKCIVPNPAKRLQRAEQFCDELLEILHGAHLDGGQIQRASQAMTKKNFLLLDVLREKAQGAVYLFVEKQTRKRYVVKKSTVMHGGFELGRRLAGMNHTNWVNVFGVSANERSFISVMDYMAGGSLEERLLRPFSLDEFLQIADQLCTGLAHAHHHRIVHGNLRASNVFFDEMGVVHLGDFGWPAQGAVGEISSEAVNKSVVAFSGMPDEEPSERLDVYSCGVLFYQMLIGDAPRYHKGALARGRAFKKIPANIQDLLLSMLQLDATKRPGSMGAVVKVLDEFRNDFPTQVWSEEPVRQAVAEKTVQQKQTLLLLLLVLLFMVLVNTGVIALLEGREMLFLERWKEFLIGLF